MHVPTIREKEAMILREQGGTMGRVEGGMGKQQCYNYIIISKYYHKKSWAGKMTQVVKYHCGSVRPEFGSLGPM